MAKITKTGLVDALAARLDMSKRDVESVVDGFVAEVTQQLQGGHEVTLTGFGTFKTSDRAARQGVNPKTGEKIQIAATTVPKFKAGKALKDAVKK